MGRAAEQAYDDWQIERIAICENGMVSVLPDRVMITYHDTRHEDMHVVFSYDGTRDGFQRAYRDWARQNTSVEPPF